MPISSKKAWGQGALLMTIAYGVWRGLFPLRVPAEILVVFCWIAPAIAAFVTAYRAPCRKILLGTSLAVVQATLYSIDNIILILARLGTDFPGLNGTLLLFALSLFFSAFLCGAGAALATVTQDYLKSTKKS